MAVKRSTRRFKRIDEALELISGIQFASKRLDVLKALIGETPCALCGGVAPVETFCFGCLDFVCDICQPPDREEYIVSGPHTLEDHELARADRLDEMKY